MKIKLTLIALILPALACTSASAQTTYALGNWTVSAKQDKGLKWLYNGKNAELQAAATIQTAGSGYQVGQVLTEVNSGTVATLAQWTITSVDGTGGVTGITLTRKGVATTHQAAANHATTGGTGTGAVIRYNAFTTTPEMLTRNGGILDAAVSSYAQQRESERDAAIRAALATASDADIAAVATRLGVVDPQ